MDLCSAAWSTAPSPPSLTSGAAGLFTTLFFLTVHHFYGIFPLNTLSKRHQQLPRGLSRARLRVLRSRPGLPSRRAPLSAVLHRHRDGETRYREHSGHLRESRDVKHAPLRNDESFLVFLDGECRFSPPTERPFFFKEFSEIFVIPYSSSKLKLNFP